MKQKTATVPKAYAANGTSGADLRKCPTIRCASTEKVKKLIRKNE